MAIQFKNMILSFFCNRVRVGDADTDGEIKHHEEVSNDAQSSMRMQQEMELQLHEQYAVNNNAYVGSTLTFIGSVLAVLYAYGYVFLHTSAETLTSGIMAKDDTYTIGAFLLTADAAIIVLAILYIFCLDRGAYQRKEQFIIYAIRCKYFSEQKGCSTSDHKIMGIFPESYTPFKKCENDFVQGVFGFMMDVATFLGFMIAVATFCKLKCFDILFPLSLSLGQSLFFACAIFTFGFCWHKKVIKYAEYKDLEKDYSEFEPNK